MLLSKSDLFEQPQLKQAILQRYPSLQPDAYEASILAIWLVLSSAQTLTPLLSVEINSAKIDVDAWVKAMIKHYRNHFEQKAGA